MKGTFIQCNIFKKKRMIGDSFSSILEEADIKKHNFFLFFYVFLKNIYSHN